MSEIEALQAELQSIGRECHQVTSVTLNVLKTDYLPQLIIFKKLIGWEVHTNPKRIIITFKEMDAKSLVSKLSKANFLSEQINFDAIK